MKEKVFSDWYHQTRDITARAGFDAAWQHQQAKVEELQKRVDVTLRALKRQSEDMLREAKFYQDETHIERFGRQIKHIHDELEQAHKGECSHESDGTNRLSLPPKTKCKKCGGFYSDHELKDGDQ